VIAVRARDGGPCEIVEERADLRIGVRRAALDQREQEVRAAPVPELGALLLEERARRYRGGVAAAGRGQRVEKERLLVDVGRVRDVGRAVHKAEHVRGRAADDAGVDRDAVPLGFAERDECPAGHVRVRYAGRLIAPGPSAVGTLPSNEAGDVARYPPVAVARYAGGLLSASHRERGDEPARHVLGSLVRRWGEI